ncbi:transmembrane and ubiquitin-like domain-containing protein 1 isoform X1 [Sceloporus undulatus]|uniref:transmembrane and ubiquitin-like domain-containing protein 1 isoform X1 n=1 Tax=Sceloporus undulatus TaxID=8520 RepID=UPI001C4CCB18|nr:transmembrane and ubiquitin-like domain-containing protein 1 isoform X1 [Sceloporus undulatus]XP_042328163.1 transmembrane and ubiquitin-like domain-containing protein 1 isoform X1 [Sceloporus undulatus]
MALIEGVGDEVTALFGALAVLLVLALAWFSTRTAADRGDPLLAPAAVGQREEPRGEEEGEPSLAAAPDRPGGGPPRDAPRRRTVPGPTPQPPLVPPPAGSSTEPPPREGAFILRLKFLNDTERLARVRPEDTVGALKRAHFPGQEQLVRLIYQGQLLRDDSQTLAALHLTDHSVLHCHISQHRPTPAPTGGPAHAGAHAGAHTALNVGSLMVPLFVLMVGALWYFQMQYRHVFTTTATTCLAGLTLIFSFVAFAVYRR